ncbi:cysteine and histidine-rich domain-containing protein-like [Teleopsis dalmanni]|uniref:cysteine and histidine-rich domain-containing protein-like n=1 Tax=Teleopsis dalmanni TaxID=139649 RepID=UPI000D329478|nr:cysteine and histidine-rich domain-containing protein-like [Teleopsis dalmanni]
MLHCYNRGCGKTYDPEQNTDDSCQHHPGEPYFHDAYKGWSCCKKKSVDFTEFLNIPGCKFSKHSNIKPPEPEKPQKNETSDKDEVIEVRAPIKAAMPRPPIETTMSKIEPIVAATLKEAIDNRSKSKTQVDEKKLADGEIPVGTACKNSGCKYSFTGTGSDYLDCQYHPGVPIFHEGMKYWSCCQKKTTDFTVFMSQPGCINGHHKWFKENDDKKVVKCRHDWHQTASNVIVSVYAKMYDYSQSTIEVNPIRLHVNLVFPEQDNAIYNLDLELRGVIDVSKTTVHMYASKVEITLPKAEPGSWSMLDFPHAKLPPVQKTNLKQKQDSVSDDDVDLDDIDSVSTGLHLTEISTNKNDLD